MESSAQKHAGMLAMAEKELGASNMLVKQYLEWLVAQDRSSEDAEPAPVVWDERQSDAPFLSVICRTQGKRIEEFQQALASLQGQSCKDFELLVVGHDIDEEAESRIVACLDELDEWMRGKTMFLKASGGTRSRPLNVALPYVSGRYFSVFDEDDLVYENWVSTFSALADAHPDHVLYCFVETQFWHVEVDDQGRRIPVEDASEKGVQYCKHPNDLALLAGNQCPFMGLAFPSILIRDWGFRFNEGLNTTEDWDFFMRARNVYPFVSSDEHVALYRLWSLDGGYSTKAVDQDEWKRSHAQVQADKANAPLLFAPGFSEQARQAMGDAASDGRYLAEHMELFLDVGSGFDPRYFAKPLPVAGELDAYVFTDLKRFGPVGELRVDPVKHGPFALVDYSLEIWLEDGASFIIVPEETRTNGRISGGQYEFPGDDPQIVCTLPAPETLDKVVFRFERAFSFAEEGEQPSVRRSKAKSLVNRLRR